MKTFKEKIMNRKSNNKQTVFFFQKCFYNRHFLTYMYSRSILFSNFSTKQNTTDRGITVIVSELHF